MRDRHDYRPDIDALRGLAVAAVVLFHAFPEAVPGGFVGVDVFFVISGYLITGIVREGMQAGAFSPLRFYSRRINRIFPALLLVLAACGAAGWWLLMRDEYAALGTHAFGASVFGSNFLLLSESGYFDEAAHAKPLLHLWSLAIEEQFYLVWPVVLWLALMLKRPLQITVLLALASFTAGELMMPGATAFYHPALRAWELLAGAALAGAPRWPARWAWLAGVALVVPMFLLSGRSDFPGWWALLPVGGAAAIIATEGPMNRALASQRWLVGLGLISYPLYLWHWPLLSFARIVAGRPPPVGVRAALVGAAVLLAWATYRFVERRMRSPAAAAWKSGALIVLLAGTGAVGVTIAADPPERAAMARYEGKFREAKMTGWLGSRSVPCPGTIATEPPTLRYCHLSKAAPPAYAILGDSHADHLFHGLTRADDRHAWLVIGHNSMPPLLDVQTAFDGRTDDRQERARKAVNYLVASPSVKTVFISFFWNTYLLDEPYAADASRDGKPPSQARLTSTRWQGGKPELIARGLGETVAALQGAGQRVVLLIDLPELPFLPRDCLDRPGVSHDCRLARADAEARQKPMREIVASVVAAHPGTLVHDLADDLCDAESCHFETPEALLYRDSNHLTMTGSVVVAKKIVSWIEAHP